jgi:hypothetical protein
MFQTHDPTPKTQHDLCVAIAVRSGRARCHYCRELVTRDAAYQPIAPTRQGGIAFHIAHAHCAPGLGD